MAPCSERDSDLHWWRVASGTSISAIGAVGSVSAVSARGWIIRIRGTGTAARSGHSIAAIHTAGAGAAGEIRNESVVVAYGYVEVGCVDVGVTGHGDGDVRQLSIADSGIFGKGHDAFLIGGRDSCRDREVLPQNLSFAGSFGL